MSVHALPMPTLATDAQQARALAAAETQLHQIQQRLQRLQADFKVQQAEQAASQWPARDRRWHERRGGG